MEVRRVASVGMRLTLTGIIRISLKFMSGIFDKGGFRTVTGKRKNKKENKEWHKMHKL